MNKDSDVNTLSSTSGTSSAAIGPVFYLEIEIEGVPVRAVVDSGAQSTVISRDLLHKVNRQRKANGHPCLTLGLPSATLHGKGGKHNSKLCITAQVELQLAVDGLVVTAPVFVQPSSSVPCLLGTNVLPQLGIRVVRANGQSLVESSVISGIPKSSRVHIIKSTYVPSRRATFVEAEMHSPLFGSDAVEFEPELRAAGLNATNCLLTKMPNGHLWIPIENCSSVSSRLTPGVCIGMASPLAETPCKNNELPTMPDAACFVVTAQSPGRTQHVMDVFQLTPGSLSPEQFNSLKRLIADNADVFALNDAELGHTDLVQHQVDTGDHPPIKQPVRRVLFVYRDKIGELVADMEKQGVVEPSTSLWASPVVLVPKKDGQYRFCIDYRRLNSVTRKDVYPLPRIYDILDTLGGMKFFSSLDLASGYWQIGMGWRANQEPSLHSLRIEGCTSLHVCPLACATPPPRFSG